MKNPKIDFSDFDQCTIIETLTPAGYYRVSSLYSYEGIKYLVEVLFKSTHSYRYNLYSNYDDAIRFYTSLRL